MTVRGWLTEALVKRQAQRDSWVRTFDWIEGLPVVEDEPALPVVTKVRRIKARFSLRRRFVRALADPLLPVALGAVLLGAVAVFAVGYLAGRLLGGQPVLPVAAAVP